LIANKLINELKAHILNKNEKNFLSLTKKKKITNDEVVF
jgi:hypothetical protein